VSVLEEPLALDPSHDESLDVLLRGQVHLLQSRRGYRTSVDAMALAWFAAARQSDAVRVLELGAGSGLVSLLLLRALPLAKAHLVELQPQLARRAERNLRLNSVADRATVQLVDLAVTPTLPTADLVVCNPPFRTADRRTLPSHPERRLAHVESSADLATFARAAALALAETGRSCWVFPWRDRERLWQALDSAGLRGGAWHPLGHREGDPEPVRVLVSATKGGVELREATPLFLHAHGQRDEHYHPAIETFLADLAPRQTCGPSDRLLV
jgi:tRNA1Val (adenine37-N6)-methyltransferase